MSHHRSVVKAGNTNYQSIIAQKNCLVSDSNMYEKMENYICNILHLSCSYFYEARGEVWVDSLVRCIKTRKPEDLHIMVVIWKRQKNKIMLVRLLCGKAINIFLRKIRMIE